MPKLVKNPDRYAKGEEMAMGFIRYDRQGNLVVLPGNVKIKQLVRNADGSFSEVQPEMVVPDKGFHDLAQDIVNSAINQVRK